VLEDRVLKKISGLKMDEVTGGRRRLYKEELYDLYSPTILLWGSNHGE
jgi:hypothetical protein